MRNDNNSFIVIGLKILRWKKKQILRFMQKFSNLSKHRISQIFFTQLLFMQRHNLNNICWPYFTHDVFHSVDPERFPVGD